MNSAGWAEPLEKPNFDRPTCQPNSIDAPKSSASHLSAAESRTVTLKQPDSSAMRSICASPVTALLMHPNSTSGRVASSGFVLTVLSALAPAFVTATMRSGMTVLQTAMTGGAP
jgi:hypothetical protein